MSKLSSFLYRRARGWIAYALIALAVIGTAGPSQGKSSGIDSQVAALACAAITERVDRLAGNGAVFLRSYDSERGTGEPGEPALRTAAFTYDNALATIALIACGARAQAERVGEALRLAALSDMRLRNVYRAGAVGDKPLPNGWWDRKASRWFEDSYQDGTATGNVAWAALALLALHDATGELHWRDAAARLATWVAANTGDARVAGGFTGGIEGFDAAPKKVLWKSTEHNIDLVALFTWLDRVEAKDEWRQHALQARSFVDAQWDAASGHFWIGTLADGVTPNRIVSALDVQLWSQLLPDADKRWPRALVWAERKHGVAGGFDFNDDRDGSWTEGAAQAALVYRRLGRGSDADALLATIARQTSEGGFVYATREPRITTGLAIGGDSTSADFYYYRRPHLGATAWAALAALNRNPFISSRGR